MKKHHILLILLSISALLTTSCVVYHPHNTDIPLLEEQGDLHVDVSASLSAPLLAGPAANISVAYAPLQLLGITAAASVTDFRNYHVQASAGTYQPLGATVLECYIGYGYGSAFDTISSSSNAHEASGNYNLVFSQINIGWNAIGGSGFDCGIGFKGGLLSPEWTVVKTSTSGDNVTTTIFNEPHFLMEPQLMARFGGDHFKVSLNIAFAYLSNWAENDNPLNYDRLSVGIGLHYKF